jgi:hypothetical protein
MGVGGTRESRLPPLGFAVHKCRRSTFDHRPFTADYGFGLLPLTKDAPRRPEAERSVTPSRGTCESTALRRKAPEGDKSPRRSDRGRAGEEPQQRQPVRRYRGLWLASYFPSILKSFVPHDAQVPCIALRPFLSITSWGELISRLVFSFMQYASDMVASTNTGDKRP